MKATQLFLPVTLCFFLLKIQAHEPAAAPIKLIKNLGQQHPNVLYSAGLNGGVVYLERNALTYAFYHAADLARLDKYFHDNEYLHSQSDQSPQLRGHAYRVHFENANPNPQVAEAAKCREYYNYFFGQDESKWAGNVPLFGEVVYKNVYPRISLSVHSAGANLEYDFIVSAGADVSLIALRFEGADGLFIRDGNLVIKTSVADIIEQKPFAFQIIDGEKKTIPCEYRLSGNNVTFHFSEGYDNRYELVIDPVVVAATYSGTTYRAYAHTATYDAAGNIYSAGKAFSVNTNGTGAGYPATVGAFQTTHAGGFQDICISKYNPDGSALLWATYLGGVRQEQPHSLVVNAAQQLYIYGSSNSENYPVSATGYQRTNPTDNFGNHLTDIIVTKLNTTGSALIGSTYVGGNTEQDGVNYSSVLRYYGDYYKGEIIIDSLDNAYIASYGRSANFPVTSGAYQTTYGGGYQDGVVFKLNSNLSALLWSTFLGGPGEDACYGLKLDANGNVFVTGAISSNILTNTAGTIRPSYTGGLFDAYVANLSANGQTMLKSTYFGTVSEEQAYLLDLDKYGDVYIFGATPNSAIQPTPGAYQGVMNGSFIAKLKPTLDSTYFITTFNQLAPTALMIDECDYIYAIGHGGLNTSIGNLSGFTTTAGAFQTVSGGFYMLTLEPNASALRFGSYYGPQDSHVDGGTCRFDRRGVIYHALCTDKTTLYTTPTAFRTNKTSNDFDNTVFKIDFEAERVNADALAAVAGSSDTSSSIASCILPLPVQFINRSVNAVQYEWHFGNGDSSTAQHPLYTYTTSGNYQVMLIARDSATCNKADTAYLTVNTAQGVALSAAATNTPCNGNTGTASVTVTAGTAPFSYLWNTGDTTSAIANLTSGTYSVTVSAAGNCSATSSVAVTSSNGVTLSISSTNTTCGNSNGTVTVNTSTGSSPFTYLWNNSSASPSLTNLAAGNYSVTVTDANSCSASASAAVGSSGVTPPVVSSDKAIMCSGDSARICAPPGYSAYQWNTGQQDSCIYTRLAGNYYVTATDMNNCSASSSAVSVGVYPLPPVSISVNGDTLTGYNAVTYQWYLNNTAIPGANSSTYIATVSGDYTLAVTDSNGCRAASTKVAVTLTGVTEFNKEAGLIIYPNPSDGNFELRIENFELKQPIFAIVFDVTGRRIFEQKINSSLATLNLETFSRGVYFLKIEGNKFSETKKLLLFQPNLH